MDVYMYQAAFLCADCGRKVRAVLDADGRKPADVLDEYSFDSDDYPKGPFADGGGEADCPNHCNHCGVFLENPLTPDGEKYVRDAVSADGAPLVPEWGEYYSYLFD